MSHRVPVILTREVHVVAKIRPIVLFFTSLDAQPVRPVISLHYLGCPGPVRVYRESWEEVPGVCHSDALEPVKESRQNNILWWRLLCIIWVAWFPPYFACSVEEVLLTKLRESRLRVVTYVAVYLKRSCLDHIPELGEVELIERWWCQSPCMNLEVATSLLPWLRRGGGAMSILLWPPPDRALTRPVKNSHPKHKK